VSKRLLSGLLVLGVATAALVRAEDVVTHKGKGPKADVVKGTIEKEGPGGIRIKDKKETHDIPALEVVGVVYDQKKTDALSFRGPFSKLETLSRGKPEERKKQLPELLKELKELETKFNDNPRIERHIQYCLCQIALLEARDDAGKRDAAIAALVAFKNKHKDSWQIVPALTALAHEQEEKGDVDGALQSYQELTGLPDVPKELKLTSELFVGQMLMRRGRYADAEKKWAALLKDGIAPNDPKRPLYQAVLIQCRVEQNKLDGTEAELRKLLTAGDDPVVKAMAYNTLGDFYQKKGNKEEAFWQYLRVDVLYPQDVAEHARALYHLSKLFDKPKNDPVRAQQCRDKLKEEVYKGTEYRARLDVEK
jgi:tetratricopeptide (TPR) repeat protein